MEYITENQELKDLGNKLDKLIKKEVQLTKYNLQHFRVTQDTISPFLLNTKNIKDAIYKDGFIFIGHEKLYFESQADEALAMVTLKNDDEMVFYIKYPYFCVTKKENYDKYQQVQNDLQELRKQKKGIETKINSIEEEIKKYEFWKKYNIPFNFISDIKIVLSGLTESSLGNGCNKATVNHIRVAEDIKIGRLKRKAGDYLCTQQKGSTYCESVDNKNINEVQEIITCKQCLKMIEKYKY